MKSADNGGSKAAHLGEGRESFMVTRLARLARATRDLLNILAQIAERGAGFRSYQHSNRQPRRADMYAYVQAFLEQVLVSVACNGAHSLKERLARGCS